MFFGKRSRVWIAYYNPSVESIMSMVVDSIGFHEFNLVRYSADSIVLEMSKFEAS